MSTTSVHPNKLGATMRGPTDPYIEFYEDDYLTIHTYQKYSGDRQHYTLGYRFSFTTTTHSCSNPDVLANYLFGSGQNSIGRHDNHWDFTKIDKGKVLQLPTE